MCPRFKHGQTRRRAELDAAQPVGPASACVALPLEGGFQVLVGSWPRFRGMPDNACHGFALNVGLGSQSARRVPTYTHTEEMVSCSARACACECAGCTHSVFVPIPHTERLPRRWEGIDYAWCQASRDKHTASCAENLESGEMMACCCNKVGLERAKGVRARIGDRWPRRGTGARVREWERLPRSMQRVACSVCLGTGGGGRAEA